MRKFLTRWWFTQDWEAERMRQIMEYMNDKEESEYWRDLCLSAKVPPPPPPNPYDELYTMRPMYHP